MEREYAAKYRELYGRHWWWRARERFIIERLEDLLPARKDLSILDVGCGDGLMFEALSRFGRVEGVEIDSSSLSTSSSWLDQIFVGPFDETFDPGTSYDLILMLDSLEHFAEPSLALRRAVDILDPRGFIVVTVPAFRQLWTHHDDVNAHVTRFTRSTLRRVVADAGATIVSSLYFFHWLAPVKLALRAKESLIPPIDGIPSVPFSWLNRALFDLSRLEQRSLSRVPVPFGSSLYAVIVRSGDRSGAPVTRSGAS